MSLILGLSILLFISCDSASENFIKDPGFGECPEANGCECESSDSCPENSECTQLKRGKYCIPQEGSIVPQFIGIDQFGNDFSLYDLALKGKPILIEICSASGKACNELSAWLARKNNAVTNRSWFKDKFLDIRSMIDNGEMYWINIVHIDENKNPATSQTVMDLYDKYPHPNIILLADPESKMKTWIRPEGMPCMILVDEKMVIKARDIRGIEYSIDGLYRMLH